MATIRYCEFHCFIIGIHETSYSACKYCGDDYLKIRKIHTKIVSNNNKLKRMSPSELLQKLIDDNKKAHNLIKELRASLSSKRR